MCIHMCIGEVVCSPARSELNKGGEEVVVVFRASAFMQLSSVVSLMTFDTCCILFHA